MERMKFCHASAWEESEIKSFAHTGARRFFENGTARGIPQDMARRLRTRLDALNAADQPTEMDIPGWELHALKGTEKEPGAFRSPGTIGCRSSSALGKRVRVLL